MPTLSDARAALQATFGYPDFRPGQCDVVAAVVSGRDTLAVLPTGGGKSLCYQVPSLLLPGLTVVVSPLISLMKDQVDRLERRGVAATFLNSSLPAPGVRARLDRIRRGTIRLLYVAPERLESPDLRSALDECRVSLLAVDEAHCISEWGHEFRPSFRRLAASCERFAAAQRMAVTATATPVVRRDIVRQLRLRDAVVIVAGFDRANLSYAVRRCRDDADKLGALREVLRASAPPAIVYAATRASVERVTRQLRRAALRAAPYHGGLPAGERLAVQEQFMAGGVDCLVATNAFGMGIDKADVRLVAHVSMPGTLEAYYQEAGRAGRDGQPARCVLLHGPGDRETHEHFIRSMLPPPDLVRRTFERLRHAQVGGRVPASPADHAVIAFLERQGVVARTPPDRGRFRVRLLATPERIARELGEGTPERGLLDRVIRAGGRALGAGAAIVSLDAARGTVPPAEARETLHALATRHFLHVEPVGGGIRLTRPALPLEDFRIDWDSLRRRTAFERSRLELMARYVTTRACRRAYVLSYFGERVTWTRCRGCDNCHRD